MTLRGAAAKARLARLRREKADAERKMRDALEEQVRAALLRVGPFAVSAASMDALEKLADGIRAVLGPDAIPATAIPATAVRR